MQVNCKHSIVCIYVLPIPPFRKLLSNLNRLVSFLVAIWMMIDIPYTHTPAVCQASLGKDLQAEAQPK